MTERSPTPPTVKQQQILDAITAYTVEHGYPPLLSDLMVGMGWSSPGTAHAALDLLESKGLISRVAGKARTLKVVK